MSRGSTGTLSLYALQDYQDISVMFVRYINLIAHANRQLLRRDLLHNGVGFTEIAYSKRTVTPTSSNRRAAALGSVWPSTGVFLFTVPGSLLVGRRATPLLAHSSF